MNSIVSKEKLTPCGFHDILGCQGYNTKSVVCMTANGDNKDIDIILSHTCPKKYIPTEMFLPMIDQSSVDNSTEEWLDTIEDIVNYKAWYCGHWHTDKRVDKMHFLFTTFESLGD